MSVECFLDTNVLVHAVSREGSEEAKRNRARELIETSNFGLSVQVLQEFYVATTRKIKVPLSSDDALDWVNQLAKRPCLPIGPQLVVRGIELSTRYKTSYWDGAILAAAEAMGAQTLYTEDLSDGQLYGSVRAINPFASS
jgi:predicted nucleic acid-binding protein